MTALATDTKTALLELLLAVADEKLMLGTRNSDWTGLGPILEEDIAFSSLAQDELAHAQALYELAATIDEQGRDADALAFGRSPGEYRCAQIVELPDEFNYATALARQLFCDHFDLLRLQRLTESSYAPLAQLAKRLVAEEHVHVEHSDAWVIRLGRGNAESNARMQRALDALAPQAVMLFEPVQQMETLVREGLYPVAGDMFEQWQQAITSVCTAGTLHVQLQPPDPTVAGGRQGVHTPQLTELLNEMCAVYRLEPDAKW